VGQALSPANRFFSHVQASMPGCSWSRLCIAIRTINVGIMVDKAHVTQADIAASNGVIHVIDTVIGPE
jgi:uncharacterized surface protein with fasciclin (FAS1) repeats